MICWQDFVNGGFEVFAGISVLLHIVRIVKDKEVKGVSIVALMFFTSWGFWNLYYYPFLSQWVSFVAGILIVSTNVVYTSLAIHYSGRLKFVKKLFTKERKDVYQER